VLASADKETQGRKEQDPLKSKDEKGKMLLSKTLKKPIVFSAKVTSNATNVWFYAHSPLGSNVHYSSLE
jgi:hypothetical protein